MKGDSNGKERKMRGEDKEDINTKKEEKKALKMYHLRYKTKKKI